MEQHPSDPPPSYGQTVGESSCGYSPAPTGEHEPVVRGPDVAYLKSVAGIVRIVEAVSEIVL